MSIIYPIFEEQIRSYNAIFFFHENPAKHLLVFFPETVNIKKLANLTANSKNYGQITLNSKPHSGPPGDILKFLVWKDRAGRTNVH